MALHNTQTHVNTNLLSVNKWYNKQTSKNLNCHLYLWLELLLLEGGEQEKEHNNESTAP